MRAALVPVLDPEVSSPTGGDPAAPGRLLQLLELRAAWELAAGVAAFPWLLQLAPRGDGHPVLVLPGLAAGDGSTRLLRSFLACRGYRVEGWGLGRNWGPRAGIEDGMLETLDRLHARDGCKVSLIGQSLGGAYARLLAVRRPDAVRCVITLGSPVGGHPRSSNAWRLYEFASGKSAADPRLARQLRQASRVPTTAIYSRSDGVVAWQNSMVPSGPQCENIEVVSSHVGMAVHPLVLHVVADRLAQPGDQWQPFAWTATGGRIWR